MKPHGVSILSLATLTCFFVSAARGDGAAAPGIDTARATLAKWMETEQVIAKEQREWQEANQVLESRIGLVRSEIEALEERLVELKGSGSGVADKKHELFAEDRALQEAATGLQELAGELEGELRQLFERLPEPVRAKLSPLYSRIPANPAHTNVSLAERFQNLVGILNEVGKANNEITMATEVRTLADGRPTEVRTVYVGLAQAYFVSASGEAGIGRPGQSGWQWETASGLAPQILQVVEVLQNKATPKFVPLPVKVQ